MSFDKNYLVKLNNNVVEVDWMPLLREENDVNSKYVLFYSKFLEKGKEVGLVKNMKGRKYNAKKPWITQDLLRKINLRDRLFKLQALKPRDENKEHYLVFRNGLDNFLYEAKKKVL